MKKVLLFLAAAALSGCAAVSPDTTVYLCKSSDSTRYHLNKECSGLHNCGTNIEASTKKETRKSGRRLCKMED